MNFTDCISNSKTYIYYEDRLASFDTWSKQISPDGFQLAKAGFYYTGFGDKIACFSCDIKLCHWEKADNPWIEHCEKSPNCLFVKLVGHKTNDCSPMDIASSYPNSQFVFRPLQPSKENNPLFSIFASDSK